MEIRFLGAAGTVTGSRFLVSGGGARVLVDCGLYQGVKPLRLRNWRPFPVPPGDLDAVFVTHAHIDHSGYLPALVRDGFRGPVYCTQPTADLCGILLPDSAHLHEEDAAYANRKHFSKHEPALPLYTGEDAQRALTRLAPVDFGEAVQVGELRLRFAPAGHILGASTIEVEGPAGRLLFSGDLGRFDDLWMHPPELPDEPDWIVVESTYGDRLHDPDDPIQVLGEVLSRTVARGGSLLLPSFAVGRAQVLLYCLHQVFERGLAPRVPVFVNSPMATDVTRVYQQHVRHHRLSAAECAEVCGAATFVQGVEQSKALVERRDPLVVISASGMATGGRVLHHLKALAPDPRNTLLLPGFQAPGTRGAQLAAGAEAVKIHGGLVPVRAEVLQLSILSAHADQRDLLQWLAGARRPPRQVFVVHGEPSASDTLRRRIQDDLGWAAHAPEHLEHVALATREAAAAS